MKLIKILTHPNIIILYLMNKGHLRFLTDERYIRLRYYLEMGKKLNLINPQTFNEKLQWLKLHDKKDLYTTLVDKYEVKKYVKNIIGEEYIIPTICIYDKLEDINFDDLPNQFVMKCTHDSGGLLICKDKSKLNIKEAKKNINKFFKRKYFYIHREWPYKNIKPRILIEKYITNKKGVLDDFKLQTFNGKVAYSFVCTDRAKGKVKYTFFDKNKKFIPVTQCGAPNDPQNAKLPNNYKKFVELAELLAKDIPEVRMDFYNVDGKIYFGEFTFFDAAGFGAFDPPEWDYKFGSMLDLSELEKNKGENK